MKTLYFLFSVLCLADLAGAFVHCKIFDPQSPWTKTSTTTLQDFDFSCTAEWETFYQEESRNKEQPITEWHSSVDVQDVLQHIPVSSATYGASTPRCLLVGCGTSEIPSALLQLLQNNPNQTYNNKEQMISLLDSSPTCMQRLKERYGDGTFDLICGDALHLESTLPGDSRYDVVLDKGLMDAFLCGDDWDRTIVPLLEGASKVLNPKGRYLLVSYKLATSTREFLRDRVPSLEWEFDVEGSNDRVGISIGRKVLD